MFIHYYLKHSPEAEHKTLPRPITVRRLLAYLESQVQPDIIREGIAMNKLHSFSEDTPCADPPELIVARSDYRVRLASTAGHRSQASMLVERLYSCRGYVNEEAGQMPKRPNVITLIASREKQTFGTISVGADSDQGLLADELYRQEIDEFRAAGKVVGEISKLAVDPEMGSKEVLASLFHLAYMYLGPILGVTDIFAEVNPRHGPFYRRMLGFRQVGLLRNCPRVNAPAILLHLKTSLAAEKIAQFGGSRNPAERSLYPYFFSPQEEVGLMLRTQNLPST